MIIKTFTATRRRERETLGETVTEWIRSNPYLRVVDKHVRQSSDKASHHCMTITLICERVKMVSPGLEWPIGV